MKVNMGFCARISLTRRLFQVKEKELQDLLDAKTTALTKSDRFIAQYRCRSAQSEAEVHFCILLRVIS